MLAAAPRTPYAAAMHVRSFIVALACVVAAGCESRHQENWSRLKPGMTKTQVEDLLGEPSSRYEPRKENGKVVVTGCLGAKDGLIREKHPAVLAVTREQYIAFASNAFAILGLRALYFLLADMRERFRYLQTGLGVILAFVGVKMVVSYWWHMPIAASLAIIATILTVSVVASIRTDNAAA